MYFNCHTVFSFKYGTLSIEKLYAEAQRCRARKIALTEINNTASYIELLRLRAEKKQTHPELPPIDIALGIEFRNGHELQYIALAKNNNGFEKINRFLSYQNREGKEFPVRAPEFEDVLIVYPFGKINPETLCENESIGVRNHQLTKRDFQAAYKSHPQKFVAWHPVTFQTKVDFNTHRLLRAIDKNLLLSKLPPHEQAQPDEVMVPEVELKKNFQNYPGLIANACTLLDQCSIDFELGTDKNKKHITGSKESDWGFLVTRAWKGFQERYNANDPIMRERFEREIGIIQKKEFCSYFLIAYDIIRFAKESGFEYVGRGSGANSMIAFCLDITNVDPLELDLYFERFLNPERTSPPDFDMDFSWKDRDAIYEYIFTKYGTDHVCLLGTHVTYQSKSVLRELAKVFGLPKNEIDEIVDRPVENKKRDHITELIFRYAERIKDFPANISIHAGGVLITEKPIYYYTATEMPPKGYPVSHFEMHNAEDMGVFKFDILSQRGLGHLKEGVELVKKNKGIDVNIHRFRDFQKDEKIKTLLRDSKAMGCFYVESPAMRMLLGKLRCEDYITLVAASSIIRPGVARSGMMRAYIERFHITQTGGTYESIHPKMDELMAETYGVMVYQEDVIKVAHHFAKLTLSEADILRRGMSGKFRSRAEFERVRETFFKNCNAEGYDPAVTERVWYEIESFSGYSFSKGHSASYAVESYQSLYLKAHYPLEFMVGVINNFGGFYRTEFYFHEARMNGGKIQAPCINLSGHNTTIVEDRIYIGFVHLKSLNTKTAQLLILERQRNGDYKTLNNFLQRNPVGLEQVRILIRIGAFRFTKKNKQRLLWEAMLFFGQARSRTASAYLFDTEPKEYPLPVLQRKPIEDAFDEIELLGFPLCDPFELVNTNDHGDTHARELIYKAGKIVTILGYLVTTKNTSTKNHELMHFGTFYDSRGEVFDTVHFPIIAKKYPMRGRGFYLMRGKVTEDFGIAALEVEWMDKIPMINKRAENFMREGVS